MTTARERGSSPVSTNPSYLWLRPARQSVQGDGSGPGLVVGAKQLAGERLEVLPEPTDHDLLQGRPDYEELWAVGDCAAVTDVRTCEDEAFRQRVNRLAWIIYSY